MRFSFKIGLGMLIIGIVLALVNLVAIFFMESFFPKLIIFASTLFSSAIAMLIFPGGEPGSDVPQNKQLVVSFSQAGILTKIMWILFLIMGLVVGFYLMFSLGSSL